MTINQPQPRSELEEEHKAVLRIPYALGSVVVGLLMQTMAAVWWASNLQVRMDVLKEQVGALSSLVADGRNRSATVDDLARIYGDLNSKINDHEHRLREIERKRSAAPN